MSFVKAHVVSLQTTMGVATLAPPAAMDLNVCEPLIVVEVPECDLPISEASIVQTKLPCFSDWGWAS
jgi:hypothetical protein